jgi:hypothetical protein
MKTEAGNFTFEALVAFILPGSLIAIAAVMHHKELADYRLHCAPVRNA